MQIHVRHLQTHTYAHTYSTAQHTGLCESEEQMSSVSDQLHRNVGKSCHAAVKGDKEMCGEAKGREADRRGEEK